MTIQKFIDYLVLNLESGNGASGSVSFRREKYIPRGGPDGGDGGRGGDIVFKIKKNLSNLSHLYSKKKISAEHGKPGRGRKKHGKDGEDTIIYVPLGTQIKDANHKLIKDMTVASDTFILLKGGKGGKGNIHFASSTNQTPDYAQSGLPGKRADIILEVKLIADIGLVGLPNAGKSTLIATITNAKPKIANYPFTTLTPNLGIYRLDIENNLIIADIPGIIEGASDGTGLGIEFLKHIERTSSLFFIIAISSDNPYLEFQILKKELKKHSYKLLKKNFFIGLSKVDSISADQIDKKKNLFPLELQNKLIVFSSLEQIGLEEIKKMAYQVLKDKKGIDE